MSMTVSGNTPVEEPTTPETEEATESSTQNITYNIDNTEVCSLLTQLIAEVQKNNETNSKIYETMLLHHAEYIQNHTESMAFFESELVEETEEETETETETEPETETQTHEKLVEEQLLLIGENLEEINITVSGNNTLLTDINDTATSLSESYTEQAETQQEVNAHNLAISIGAIFILALIAGLTIAKIVWGRMK